MNQTTAVNAKAQRRKGAEEQELGWAAKLNRVHLRGECANETMAAPLRLRVFAPLR